MTLPGMPPSTGGPVVFVCGPRDRARTALSVAPAPRPRGGVWLVLALCPHCMPKTGRYCSNHDRDNWWLTRWKRG